MWTNKIKTLVYLREIMFNDILFNDDLCLFHDILQQAIFLLSKIGRDYKLTISKHNTKAMAFKDKDP